MMACHDMVTCHGMAACHGTMSCHDLVTCNDMMAGHDMMTCHDMVTDWVVMLFWVDKGLEWTPDRPQMSPVGHKSGANGGQWGSHAAQVVTHGGHMGPN